MFTSESIATRTLRDHISGEHAFCDNDHVINKIMAALDELELGLRLGQQNSGRVIAWRGVLKMFLQGRDMEALVEAEKLCAA